MYILSLIGKYSFSISDRNMMRWGHSDKPSGPLEDLKAVPVLLEMVKVMTANHLEVITWRGSTSPCKEHREMPAGL